MECRHRQGTFSINDNPSLVASVAFSPDGKQIAVGNVDQTIRLYDADSGKLQHSWHAHGIAVNGVAYSPNGQYLASCGDDTAVRSGLLATPGRCRPPVGHTGPSAVSPSATTTSMSSPAAPTSSSSSGKSRATTGKEMQTFRGHKDWVTAVAFNKDGFHVVSSSVDRRLKIWEITSRELPLLAEHTAAVETVAVSPDGTLIVSRARPIAPSSCGTARPASTSRRCTGMAGASSAVVFTPDGKTLVSSSEVREIRLWDTMALQGNSQDQRAGAVVSQHPTRQSPYLFVTPDSKRLLAWLPIAQANLTTVVECWELQTGKRLFGFTETNRKVRSFSFCARWQARRHPVQHDGSVRLWKLGERAEIAPGSDSTCSSPPPAEGVADLALNADGTVLVATSTKGELKVADVAKRKVLHTIAADGDRRLPDQPRRQALRHRRLRQRHQVLGPEKSTELRQWVMGPPTGSTAVAVVAFTPDSKQLVTGNYDTTLFVLDLP